MRTQSRPGPLPFFMWGVAMSRGVFGDLPTPPHHLSTLSSSDTTLKPERPYIQMLSTRLLILAKGVGERTGPRGLWLLCREGSGLIIGGEIRKGFEVLCNLTGMAFKSLSQASLRAVSPPGPVCLRTTVTRFLSAPPPGAPGPPPHVFFPCLVS